MVVCLCLSVFLSLMYTHTHTLQFADLLPSEKTVYISNHLESFRRDYSLLPPLWPFSHIQGENPGVPGRTVGNHSVADLLKDFYSFSCAVCEINPHSFFFSPSLSPKPALDSHLPTGKLSAINDSVI